MPSPAKAAFRPHPLDGAMLYFHPATGVHVRVETEATRRYTRRAPRVVMFGITNACNLRCDFCSRDVTRASAWTVDSAASVLEGLAEAGTLEVAFGGGEPLAFRGFEELVVRLHATTPLALHVTTNGALLDAGLLARLSGALGQVRVSIYDDSPWRRAAQTLGHAGQTWGANVLVHDRALARLPYLLAELAALGARDVSLLSYVGPDPAMVLTPTGEATLSALVRASPLPCRLSVCFGARVGVPRLFAGLDDGGDCGAGLDFLGVTPDRRVQSCSFQDDSFPIESAGDALVVWRTRRDALRRASPRPGCARAGGAGGGRREDTRGLRVWQSFSGNNSGECVLVGRFQSSDEADRLLAELIPGYVPGQPYSAPWKELFARERVGHARSDGVAPDEMVTVGRVLLARTDEAPADDFPELRGMVWKRGGEVVAGGVHVHEDTSALAVVRAHSTTDAKALEAGAVRIGALGVAHGLDVVVALSERLAPRENGRVSSAPLTWQRDTLRALADGRPFAMETVTEVVDQAALTAATRSLGARAVERPRLLLSLWGHEAPAILHERAGELAASLDGAVTHVRNLVLVEHVARKNRVALLGQRQGATVTSLGGETVKVHGQLWRAPPPRTRGKKTPEPEPLDAATVDRELRARLRHRLGPRVFEVDECAPGSWGQRVQLTVRTDAPAEVLSTCAAYADANELQTWLSVVDLHPVERALRRLLADVVELSRAARGAPRA